MVRYGIIKLDHLLIKLFRAVTQRQYCGKIIYTAICLPYNEFENREHPNAGINILSDTL